MNPWQELCSVGTSDLGRLVQASLVGLRAALAHGLAQADANDPARAIVERWMAEWTGNPPPAPPDPALNTDQRENVTVSETNQTSQLLKELATYDPVVAKLPLNDPTLPSRAALVASRLAPEEAAAWRRRVLSVYPAVIFGPGPSKTAAALGTIPATPIAAQLYPIVADLLWYADNDPTIMHMYSRVYRFGMISLQQQFQRERFTRALIECFLRVRDAEATGNVKTLVEAWVDLDEAIHSLIHKPLAHPQSAFASLAQRSRATLSDLYGIARHAGLIFHVQELSGRYADLQGLTDPDADVPTDTDAAPGDVVRCTRLVLRLDRETYPGRVLYRTR